VINYMTFMPIEDLTKNILNKYQAVMIVAREARRINRIPKEERGEDGAKRVTTLAMRRVAEGLVGFTMGDEKSEAR
jgi:DNA-directed RNA polymerase omega subunit